MNAASAQASLANSSSANSFHFYDTQQINDFADQIEDVLFRISKNKVDKEQIHRSMRRTKSVELLKATRSERLLMSKPVKHSRPWDRSPHISHELMETLRAPVETDASTSVYSPHRDLPRTKEGQAKMAGETLASFKPGEIGKMFGEPPIDSCADTYQEMLLRHLLRSVERIEQEYNAMPWATVAISELKGGVGRDLASLEERLRRVKAAIKLAPKKKSGNRLKLHPMGADGFMRPTTADTLPEEFGRESRGSDVASRMSRNNQEQANQEQDFMDQAAQQMENEQLPVEAP
jgi:hypothetical protein